MASRSTRLFAPFLVPLALLPSAFAESLDGVSVEVVARRTAVLADRTVVYLCIRPPRLPAAVPPAAPPTETPGAEALQAEALRAAKTQVDLGLSAVVYAGSPAVTELSWTRPDGHVCRAYSNVDFTHLADLAELETETTLYHWVPLITEGDPAALPGDVRAALAEAGAAAHYLFEGDEAEAQAEAATLQGIDHLHAYFQLHQTELLAATARRQAEAAEQARRAALTVAQPKTETLFFWKIENPRDLQAPAAP